MDLLGLGKSLSSLIALVTMTLYTIFDPVNLVSFQYLLFMSGEQ